MRALPVACEPGAFASPDAFAAHLAEGRRLLESAIERRELPNGWAIRLPNDDEFMLSFAQWSLLERLCCPFFTFAIEREPAPGSLWVRITGPDGAKDVIAQFA